MQDFKKLRVWQESHKLVLEIYGYIHKFPKSESFGLVSQIQRAAYSIPMNISEGCGRSGKADIGRFIQIAIGSANELEYQLILSRDLKYLKTEDYNSLNTKLIVIRKMLWSLKTTIINTRNP